MVGELQSRLEHLVTYSSQLIFISGDSAASQQRSLQSFIAQQSENTEIAFVNAEARLSLNDYRQQITTQLLGPNRARSGRPLNELLAPLNQHEGPILIFICQAEHLPRPVLQELWELVLQSRFAGNRQHLNVLLFGESSWTEEAKAWLPANNRDKPLLLSTQSVRAQSPQTMSELDQLIADKRKQFEQRIQSRNQPAASHVNPLNNWWLRALLLLSFLLLFATALTWLYKEDLHPVLEKFFPALAEPIPEAAKQEISTPAGETQAQAPVAVAENNDNSAISPPSRTPHSQFADVPSINEQADEGISLTDTSAYPELWTSTGSASSLPRNQLPVRTWQEAINNIKLPKEAMTAEASDALTTTLLDNAAGKDVTADEASNAEMTKNTPNTEANSSVVQDYPIEDIVSVHQLPEEAASQPVEATTPASQHGSEAGLPSKWSLPQLTSSEFVIQIAGLSNRQLLNEFIIDNDLDGHVWVYTTTRYNDDWFVVIWRKAYPSIEAARAELSNLPAAVQAGVPFVKSVTQIQQEIMSPR